MNKITRSKNRDFTVISNVFLRDKDLSIKAKGFLAVVMAMPEDWDFSINGICQILKEGKTAVSSVIEELKDMGYCQVNILRDDNGMTLGENYSFYQERKSNNTIEKENSSFNEEITLTSDSTISDHKSVKKPDAVNDWKKNFDCYLQMVNSAKISLINDNDFFERMQKYYPNANYHLTIERMVDMYWGTEAGWNNKKKSRSKNIDMIATLKNNFGRNIVYKAKGQSDIIFEPKRSDDDLIINGVKYQ